MSPSLPRFTEANNPLGNEIQELTRPRSHLEGKDRSLQRPRKEVQILKWAISDLVLLELCKCLSGRYEDLSIIRTRPTSLGGGGGGQRTFIDQPFSTIDLLNWKHPEPTALLPTARALSSMIV